MPRPGPRKGGDPAPTARAIATDLVNAVLLRGESLATAQARTHDRRADPRLAGAAQDLAYGVLRHYGRLGFYLDRLAHRPLDPAELRGLLLVGLYELVRAETPAYAAVSEAVNLAAARHPRARTLVNGLLRSFQRRHAELAGAAESDPLAHWGFPDWWRLRLASEYPDHWPELLTTLNGHPPMTLRVNARHTSAGQYAERLRELDMGARQTGPVALTLARPVPVDVLPGFANGDVSVQDLGAQHAQALLDCADGMRVLDACAAPGGKTAHLLETHDLALTALDSDARRLERVAENCARLGLGAELCHADAGRPADWWHGQHYDRILLDAPCTASGVVRRHPDGRWLKRSEDATHLAAEQARLLDAVWPLLRRGGKLLYATCSLFKEENTEQAEHFLRRHSDARRDALTLPGGHAGQLLPSSDHDGFFYARFVKT